MLSELNNEKWRVNIAFVLLWAVALIALLRATVILDPFGFYFAFSNLFLSYSSNYSWFGIALKFICSFIIGTAIGYSIVRNPLYTAKSAAFVAGCFLTWPLYLYWNAFATDEDQYKYLIVAIYFFYIYSLVYFAAAGTRFGQWLKTKGAAKFRLATSGVVRDIAVAALSAAIGTVIAAWLQTQTGA